MLYTALTLVLCMSAFKAHVVLQAGKAMCAHALLPGMRNSSSPLSAGWDLYISIDAPGSIEPCTR